MAIGTWRGTTATARCVRAAFVGDTADDTDEIADALTEWADRTSADATVDSADSTVVITSCR